MRQQTEHTIHHWIVAFFHKRRYRKETSLGLAHLTLLCHKMVYMEPVITPFVSQIGLTLGNLIGVMREYIVHTAAVDIQFFTKMFHADAGTFNMPARIANAPWTVPF